ncbi:AAA family ATPase [Pseudomonas putida]|uniref:AAA family ATPase n=1 Tax=Pseudomonas putida TaxID=303 RepID=UPI0021642F4E|nr:ATP-binding protein [Pseudomonas putida]
MIETIEIRNFKSIGKIKLELGRVNVFIGENGAGKSNLLEAIALAGAAAAGKLDNEFLVSRGIRVTQPQHMRPRFSDCSDNEPINVNLSSDSGLDIHYEIQNDNKPYSPWNFSFKKNGLNESEYLQKEISEFVSANKQNKEKFESSMASFWKDISSTFNATKKKRKTADDFISNFFREVRDRYNTQPKEIEDFVIFSPENTKLRSVEADSQIEPLGINGEGLIRFLAFLSIIDEESIKSINDCLKLLGWFEEFSMNLETSLPNIDIHDRFLAESKKKLDLRSANEGFLYLVFYFCLFSSRMTPPFFAIDNIDTSLNPKMCLALMKQLATLAKTHGKQTILTTHNPAILDGLNLNDDDQRLFVISRNIHGYTRIKRIFKPTGKELKLSEMFMNGSLGGLPQGF